MCVFSLRLITPQWFGVPSFIMSGCCSTALLILLANLLGYLKNRDLWRIFNVVSVHVVRLIFLLRKPKVMRLRTKLTSWRTNTYVPRRSTITLRTDRLTMPEAFFTINDTISLSHLLVQRYDKYLDIVRAIHGIIFRIHVAAQALRNAPVAVTQSLNSNFDQWVPHALPEFHHDTLPCALEVKVPPGP